MLIFALFLIIFPLFTLLDTSGTWNMNRPATKTTTQDTYSALPGSKNFILPKNGQKILFSWSQVFCQFLARPLNLSIGHAFHLFKMISALFKLIFFVVTSFVLLSEEKMSKK